MPHFGALPAAGWHRAEQKPSHVQRWTRGSVPLPAKTRVVLVDRLYVLFLHLGLNVNVAKTLSFIAGTTTAYLINRRWTFQAPPSRSRFVAVVLLYAVTYAVQVGINYTFYTLWDDKPWRVPVAFVIAQGTATVINFVVQRAVIFKLR